jgi:hypothetical protein
MEDSSSQSTDNSMKVLKFWHIIEFFTPFDLDEICSRGTAQYKLTERQLIDKGNHYLPWLSEWAFNKAGGVSTHEYRYNLYLLPFNKNELTKLSQKIFPREQDGYKHFEFEEKFDDEGETCFARISLDKQGCPMWDKISLSTLPWALGKLSSNELNALTHERYERDQEKLKIELKTLSDHLGNLESTVITDYREPGVLTAQGLGALFVTLKCWAGFSPEHSIMVVIEMKKGSLKKIEKFTPKETEDQVLKLETKNPAEETLKEAVDKIAETEPIEQADILNSFYLEDLERVMNDIVSGKHDLLEAYLLGINDHQKTDLHAIENYSSVLKKLKPCYLNQGRWPVNDKNLMSLMQQFVLNESFHSTRQNAILSVNGPPGTGKTTLFQDVVAENITRRAKVLSEFNSSKETFSGSLNISFSNSESRMIRLLDEKLIGFEMIVVSSNNAAVENISKEFPLKRKISQKYQKNCRYLEPIASKVFSLHKNNAVIPLPKEDKPWGLISVALGNSKNRNQFRDRAFFKPEDKDDAAYRINRGESLTVWEWSKQYKGLTFLQAKDDFKKADNALKDYLNLIKRFEELHEKIGGLDVERYCVVLYRQLKVVELAEGKLDSRLNEMKQLSLRLNQEKKQIQSDIAQSVQIRPGFFQRILNTKAARIHEEQLNKLRADWSHCLDKERTLKEELKSYELQIAKVTKEKNNVLVLMSVKKDEYSRLEKEYVHLSTELVGIVLPSANRGQQESTDQMQAFWQNERLNELRTTLFIAALTLHEAWLAEVLKSGLFTGNLYAISALLSNKRLVNASNELPIWQSFFMWVPVVSSTFASVARQFKNIGRQAFGWFLIDEAGQAIPQAAVGAIWRAKRSLVVGDPLQIEPVFTTPPNLIEGLAKELLPENIEQWLPTLISVQTLADGANPLGTYADVTGKNQWIGCPLRVHRRCLDPMFSVANQIAYDQKMISARINPVITEHYHLGESCWYHLKGEATDKQYVEAQGHLLFNLLVQIYEQEQKLPVLYIITPFKRVKQNLQRLLGDSELWPRYQQTTCKPPRSETLRKWCARHIGTVHTFQGKESSAVIFILGADENSAGAINWASSKPNLLNVALTRARDRIYLIGDYELWSRKRYFSDLSQALTIVNV